MGVCFSYREALCDGNLYVEEKDSGSESCTDSNGLLGVADHAAHAAGNQTYHHHCARLNLSNNLALFTSS